MHEIYTAQVKKQYFSIGRMIFKWIQSVFISFSFSWIRPTEIPTVECSKQNFYHSYSKTTQHKHSLERLETVCTPVEDTFLSHSVCLWDKVNFTVVQYIWFDYDLIRLDFFGNKEQKSWNHNRKSVKFVNWAKKMISITVKCMKKTIVIFIIFARCVFWFFWTIFIYKMFLSSRNFKVVQTGIVILTNWIHLNPFFFKNSFLQRIFIKKVN